MTARHYAVFGALVFIAFLVAFAPASLVTAVLAPQLPEFATTETRGTVWSGSTRLSWHGAPLGRMHWRFRPAGLLTAHASYDTWLAQDQDRLDARVDARFTRLDVSAAGELAAGRLDPVFRPYDLFIPGTFRLDGLTAGRAHRAQLPDLRGELHWSGGQTRYRLGDAEHVANLPPMVGFIDTVAGQPELAVYAVDDETPLILARLAADGWLTIGITKRFTQLTAQPWHGDQPEHAVVVEVQEKLF
jgi:hypothetical protein